ncbi:MAG: type II toxin-antitoxin system RelE/ParE family toxin [Chitinophagales bacterium]|jgi:hypothetical protein|nr:type II toxin-antitoxin system RelE/ParE family toxin [Saprospirales bacterium]MBK8351045.1 type II toxin-antitoxin system RelE/ParE family toxin [Saprospirales bacterium]MBP6660931.1 type II toxin-antitoxin system RelE/ParE family toxin [Chitinophagales bacterium]
MKYEIEIIEEAENDVFEIIKWYNEQQENLGFEFYEVLLMMYDEICVQPLHFKFIFKQFRKTTTLHFPYNIFFRIDGDKIIVVGVFHQKRKPSLWRKRLKTKS